MYGPTKLYIYSDGPKNSSDEEKVNSVRNLIDSFLFKFPVEKEYNNQNIGCGRNIYNAINDVLGKNEQVIFLEDDTLPKQDFFKYVDYCLNTYKYDTHIGQVSGYNLMQSYGENSFFFTKYPSCWGWATWSRSLSCYDYVIDKQTEKIFLKKLTSLRQKIFWKIILYRLRNNYIDTWDYQWTVNQIINDRLTIIPHANLIFNQGVGAIGQHSRIGVDLHHRVDCQAYDSSLKDPENNVASISYDEYIDKNVYSRSWAYTIYLLIRTILKELRR
jgi:hypothetical protein